MSVTKSWVTRSLLIAACSVAVAASGCNDSGGTGGSGGTAGAGGTELTADAGQIGLVIDTREIFKKGYTPASVELSFADHADRNTTLEVNPLTNLAILRLANDSLSEEDRAAFSNGVTLTIAVFDEDDNELAHRDENNLVLDDSNRPLSVDTNMSYVKRPLNYGDGVPYLVQIEGRLENVGGPLVLNARRDNYCCADLGDPPGSWQCVTGADKVYLNGLDQDPERQLFLLTAVDGENTFLIPELSPTGYPAEPNQMSPEELVFTQDDDGWIKMRVGDTTDYLQYLPAAGFASLCAEPFGFTTRVAEGEADRFRMVSNNIAWEITDRGTVFDDPILPPTRLDFAYEATLQNCSPGTLTETVGKTDTHTRTTTFSRAESLQVSVTAEAKVGVTTAVEAGVTIPVSGVPVGVKASAETSHELTAGINRTTGEETTFGEAHTTETEVSRVREIEVPAFTALNVFDAVFTVENVRIPFVQTIRVEGTRCQDTIDPCVETGVLTGMEIVTQMAPTVTDGVISQVGEEFVDVTIRGEALMDEVVNALTQVNEIPGFCDR